MKTEYNSPEHGTQHPYRTPESETVALGSQISLCAGSQNGDIENWTRFNDGYGNGDFN